jgi:hypothetical protein
MRWAGMGEERKVYRVFVGKLEGKETTQRTGIDRRMGSKQILGRLAGRVWSQLAWLWIGTSGRLL